MIEYTGLTGPSAFWIIWNPFLFVDKNTVFGSEMNVDAWRCLATNLTNKSIFTHLKLWVAVARHNFKWVKTKIR